MRVGAVVLVAIVGLWLQMDSLTSALARFFVFSDPVSRGLPDSGASLDERTRRQAEPRLSSRPNDWRASVKALTPTMSNRDYCNTAR